MYRRERIKIKTYLRHKIENVIDIKELFALEYLDFDGKYKNYSESHQFWELCFVEEGTLSFLSEFEEIQIDEGEAILISPSRKHCYKKSNHCRAFVVCFESSSQPLRPLAGKKFKLSDEQISAMKIIINEAENSFRMNEDDLLEVLKKPLFGGQQVIIAQLEYFLICAARRFSLKEDASIVFLNGDDFYTDLVMVVKKYFSQNIRNRLDLDKICKKLNYSKSFLCHTFKKQTGETLMACFNRMKIDEATRMLKETNLSVMGIAEELGFSDVKYFDVLFKKRMGITPAGYRKKYRKDDAENDSICSGRN